jgi:hypothetical protein
MAVLLDKRTDAASKVQEILTKYGCIISSRIGLHQVSKCTEEGLIILHICGSDEEVVNLEEELSAVHRVKVQKMKVSFDE